MTHKVSVQTGGPGTGKTTILRAVISVIEALGQRVALAATTGRAAKRLGEAAGRETQTLHRLLEIKPGEGRYGRGRERRPLDGDAVVHSRVERIPARFGSHPMKDVQVLCLMNRAAVGVHRLNDRLREALNPAETEVTRFGRTFRVCDRVLQTINNYDKDVFNGDRGWVTGVDRAAGRVAVNFEDTGVGYGFSELDELQLSFAMTVHLSQRSEFPAVVVPLLTQHYPILQRNLLYTAITRERMVVVVVGNRKALAMAVRNGRSGGLNTTLGKRLSGTGTESVIAFPEGGSERPGLL